MNILQIDQNLLVWLNGLLVGKSAVLDFVVKSIAVYAIYFILPVGLLFLWFSAPKRHETLGLALGTCLLAWFVLTKLIFSKIWFRPRPDLGLIGIKELVFHRPDYSFPSDHATALFAVAISLYFFGWKKAGHWFLAFAIIVSVARVAVGVHFPLDILGGIASALIMVLIVWAFKKPIVRYIYKPVESVLKKVRLA